MLSKLKIFRYAGIFLFVAMLGSFLVYPVLKSKSAATDLDDAEKQMEMLKAEMEQPNSSPALAAKYQRLANILSDCGPLKQIIKEVGVDDPIAPAANLCVNGSLATTDPEFNRPSTITTGSGVGSPCMGAGDANYDVYSFNITGCAAFPTEVTITTCGPAGCAPIAVTDTVLYLYRNVPAGDPLTANGGLPAVFNPAAPCTNARAANSNLNGGAASTPGSGNTCNQTNTANCLGACAANNLTSGFRRQLGRGRFTVVVSATNLTDTGGYNLFVDAPAAGCVVALSTTAAAGNIGGRVTKADGSAINNAVISITGGAITEPIFARTSSFGYYNFEGLESGETYTLTIDSKRYTFTNSSQVITLQDNAAEVNFISEQ